MNKLITNLERLLGLMGLGVTGDVLFDTSDAPGGDLNLDDIFGESYSTSTTVEPANPPQPAPVATTTQAEPVIKTKTGTVYKSIEDAVSGIEHKDSLIAQLREQVKQNTGQDPLAARRPQPPQQPASYLDDGEQYFEDIAKAVSNKDTKAYLSAQQKLIWDSLGPLAPTISSLSIANAERVVSQDIPDFKGFRTSEAYERLQSESPLLAEAIRTAEANPAAAQQLPELYKVAYFSSQGRRVPELLQTARTETPPVQPRPTVHSTQVPPPVTPSTPVSQPSLNDSGGRKALISQMEAQGISNLKW